MTNEQFIYLLFTIMISAFVALLGKKRTIGYGWSFVLCFFVSPIIGFFVILCFKTKDTYKKYDFIDKKDKSPFERINTK